MTRVAVFIGTRPEAIKMAPVIRALRQDPAAFDVTVVSTGQHREMLRQVIDLFEIRVDHDLDVMQPNQTLAGLTARLITAIDALLEQARPDIALFQGDTTTVLAAALACFYRKIPTGHVEAGLRTGNMASPFPEEANRRLAAPLVTLHFPPTEFGRHNLLREGVDDARILVTGNTVIDALHIEVERQRKPDVAQGISRHLAGLLGDDWSEVPYVLITGHRRENFGEGFDQICDALAELARRFPRHRFVYPVHLNPNVQRPVHERLGGLANVRLVPPQAYSEFVALMQHSTLVLTDSGGVQEEAPGLGKPVLVMRDNTERPEGVEAGTVRLVGPRRERIVAAVSELLTDPAAYQRMAEATNPYGDGKAAGRIVATLRDSAYLRRG
jgi:UDP-N-acetylglucosamine 2-epimerase (non-hydrolysing)